MLLSAERGHTQRLKRLTAAEAEATHRPLPSAGQNPAVAQGVARAGREADRAAALTLPDLLRLPGTLRPATSASGMPPPRRSPTPTCTVGSSWRNLLVKPVTVTPMGLMVTSKTDKQSKGATEWITDREDLRIVARARRGSRR